jgi:protein-glutamine gamma-glutamyltransferase
MTVIEPVPAPSTTARLRRAWAQRPRPARDALFTLAVLAWTLLPQARHVPVWATLLAGAMLGWRGWLAWTGRPLPARGWLVALLLLGCGLTWLEHRTLIARDAGLTLLVLLCALKTLEWRTARDLGVLFYLGLFAVLAAFLSDQSLATALAMGVAIWGLLAARVLAHLPEDRAPAPSAPGPARPLRTALALSARLMAVGLPLVVVLFLFFPRLAPLWGMPDAGRASTGLSDTLTLGDLGELAQDERLALRVRFPAALPPPEALYFRGPVLSLPDGTGWRARALPPAERAATVEATPSAPPPIDYDMTVEPLRLTTLPLLEWTRTAPTLGDQRGPLQQHPADLQWRREGGFPERVRVLGQAWPEGAAAGRLASARDIAFYTALPAGAHPRTRAWASAWQREQGLTGAPPTVLADALLAHIRRQPFVYTLAPGPGGAQPVDSFWLDHRQGFCEHYASAFVVVLRALGVPARLVTGYQGGEFNPLDGVLEVRQTDAHAWAEYATPAGTWVRADPTAAVAPERIRRGQRLALPPGPVAAALGEFSPALLQGALAALAQARAAWGVLDHAWNGWVLGHSRQRQLDWLARLGVADPDLSDLGRGLALLLAGLAAAGAGAMAWQMRRRTPADPWRRGFDQVHATLVRAGLAPAGPLTPRQLIRAVQDSSAPAGVGTAPARPVRQAPAVIEAYTAALASALLAMEAQRYGRPPDSPPPPLDTTIRQARRAARRLVRAQRRRP